jgi:cyclohexanecarboxylate-CoA ligase
MASEERSPESKADTLWGLLEQRVSRAPAALLFVDEAGRRMTLGEFRRESLRMAERLKALGIGAGSVVSWVLPTSIDAFVVMAALSRLSVVQNPIVPIYGEREIGHIVDEASVEVLIVVPHWRGVDYVALGDRIASGRSSVPRVIQLGDIAEGPVPEDQSSELPVAEMEDQLGPVVASGDAVRWLFYTSGSTGLPKGARHSDRGLAAVAAGMADHMEMTGSDRSGLAFPAAHIGGPINLLASFLSGVAHILIETFEPVSATAFLGREGVTMAGSGTAFHLGYLEVQRSQPEHRVFPLLRCCPGGGAPKPPELHWEVKQRLGGVGILSGWGLTEAPVLTMGRPSDPDVKLATTEGRPLPGVDLRVVLSDGREASRAESGELRVRAPQLMHGYVNSSLDEQAFDDLGYFRTGDLGSIDADGFVTITGRLKEVVIRNGENIGCAEVEELLRTHPQIRDGVAIGLPDIRTGERVCAVLELRTVEPPLDVGALRTFLRAQGLRLHACPEQVEIVASLPRTRAGKVDKSELVESLTGSNSELGPRTQGPGLP